METAKGLADLNQNGPSKILTLANNGLIYKRSTDSQEAAETLQQEDSVFQWCHLFLLYRSVVLRVIDYGLDLTTTAQKNLLKMDRVQNEVIRVILGTTTDTPTETMRSVLGLPPLKNRQKADPVIAYFSDVKMFGNSL